jgi:hypothetical protein
MWDTSTGPRKSGNLLESREVFSDSPAKRRHFCRNCRHFGDNPYLACAAHVTLPLIHPTNN